MHNRHQALQPLLVYLQLLAVVWVDASEIPLQEIKAKAHTTLLMWCHPRHPPDMPSATSKPQLPDPAANDMLKQACRVAADA